MKTIEIEDDVYEYLRKQQSTFSGEPASDVLRRLLQLTPATAPDSGTQIQGQSLASIDWKRFGLQETVDEIMRDVRKKAVWEFLKEPQFKSERTVVGRFLSLLAFLHRENRQKFSAVESINGRSRKYFAKSESDLEQSGNSVHPKSIPGSGYWVVTNNSSESKRGLIFEVMKLLGYDGGFSAFTALRIK